MEKTYITEVPYMLDVWDYEHNPEDPGTVTARDNNSYYWVCKKCGYSRTCSARSVYLGKGKCPCCDSNKVIRAGVNDILTRVKNFDRYYDFEKNKGFDISSVGLDCSDLVNYRCSDCGREWTATVRSQVRKLSDGTYEAKGCPHYNTTKRKKDDVSFIADEPDIMRFFDYEKNTIDPKKTKINSSEIVELRCSKCGYNWHPVIRDFFRGKRRCKCCELNMVTKRGINDLLTLVPEAALSLLPEENPNVDINNLSIRDRTAVNWHCPDCGKKWSATVLSRVEGKKGSYKLRQCQDCYLAKVQITPISDVPWVLKFFDTKRNKKKPSEISVHSTEPIFFRCDDCGFAWKSSPKNRFDKKNGDCPCCGVGHFIHPGINDVLSLCPEISSILDNTRNPGLELSKKAPNSLEKYIFACHKCGYEWVDTIKNRVKKGADGEYHLRDCPKCSNKRVRAVSYDVEYPDLAKMYDIESNERPLSSITSYESNSLLLKWRCLTCNGLFEARLQALIRSQTKSTKGCPYCSSTKLRKGESFGDVHGELLDEYAQTNEIDPFTVFPGCKDNVKWVCRNDTSHTWEASFALRSKGYGKCPICYLNGRDLTEESFAAVYPDFLDMYADSNDRKPSEILYTNSEWLRWVCRSCSKEFGNSIYTVVNDTEHACPFCNNRIIQSDVNSLKAVRPDIAKYWLDTNILKADEVFITAGYHAWFSCPRCGNPISEVISDFVNGKYDCPYCDGRMAIPGETSLAALFPQIAKHYSKKNERDADHVLPNVRTTALWKCADCAQEFNASIQDMVNGDADCPFCNGRMAIPGKTSFKAKHPDLMHEWDELANYCLGIDPDQILDSYSNNVWWICSHNHDHHYEMSPSNRLLFQKRHREPCLYCKGRRRKKIFNYA